MKLYYSPGACSLADHIALHEAGLAHELVKVDLKAKTTADGGDYTAINPKGYVPALTLDDAGGTLTENIAILDYIAGQAPQLMPQGTLAHTRLLETLAFISTELHKSFGPFFQGGGDAEKQKAADKIAQRLDYLAGNMPGDYLFGDSFTVADAYLFVMLMWAKKFELAVPEPLPAYFDRVRARAGVQGALEMEGLAG